MERTEYGKEKRSELLHLKKKKKMLGEFEVGELRKRRWDGEGGGGEGDEEGWREEKGEHWMEEYVGGVE